MEADEARKLFSAAITRFQRECPMVNKADQGGKGKYADMARIWNTVKPYLATAQLSVTWESCVIDAGNLCHIRGNLRHAAGHAQPIEYVLPIPDAIKSRDGSAVQSVAQVMGSATTYAKRYALCNALGIQTGDDGDMDAPTERPASREVIAKLRETIKAKGRDEKNVCGFRKVQRLEDMTPTDVSVVMDMLAKMPDVATARELM